MEAEQAAELQQLRQSHEEMKRDNEFRNEKIDSMMALLQQLVKGKNVQEDTQTTEGQVTATSGVNTAAGTSGEGGEMVVLNKQLCQFHQPTHTHIH
ncbi:hypothetical protein COLO4_27743 [Corchorus olitorius]|uniref:Uncharacterized protein n=1 Tax=Corchorus olitorius TaxID=93759 RepID=A0A1R3HPU3_9ROSI|nr:hypothetical protein COLO4_27743 [Corchorus olitorius]